MSDRITLRGMRFLGRHGVQLEERMEPQPFEVDVILRRDLSLPAASDDLADTVDYGTVFTLVGEVVEGASYRLIEALAGAIATAALEATEPSVVDAVEVRVRKPEAPIDGPFDTVEAALIRRRPEADG